MKKTFWSLLVCISIMNAGIAIAQNPPYWNEIQAFKQQDAEQTPTKNAILFVGSSSFTKWQDVRDYFPGYPIINRGFGGSSLPDMIRYADDVIFKYQPGQIVIYCGENDFAASDTVSVATVFKRFLRLYGMIRAKDPNVPLVYVSMKPSPSRWHLRQKFIVANQLIKAFLSKQKNNSYVDVWQPMLNQQGRPKAEIFISDSLHMNAKGYAIWQKMIGPKLLVALKSRNGITVDTTKMNAFISALMKKMTLEEKIGQLNLPGSGDIVTGQAKSSDIAKKIREGKVGGLFNIKSVAKIRDVQRVAVEESRLKIPLIFGMDVIHGYETVFPIPLALSCTWNMDAVQRSAEIAAKEASADGICWTFSPMVDIARDPRWGRIAEGSGEDPYIGSQVAKAMVRGYQGDLSKNTNIMACVKHFALYGAAEAGRDYNTTDMSRIRMFNEYLPPYKAAVEAGVGSVMTSFNEIDGIPATGNKWLLTDVLRKQWGFKGFVVTDFTAINEMVDHGMGDLQAVSALALKAGVDMDMVGEGFLTTLKRSLNEGKIKQSDIDQGCRRILEAKYKLGLFSNPYKYCDEGRAKTDIFTDANRKEARAIAAESFVLLKNNNNILPLKRSGTIALIGPLADNKQNMPGTWSVAANFEKATSLLAGLKEVAGNNVKILTARGSNLDADSLFEERAGMFGKSLKRDSRPADVILQEALEVASQSDVIVAALGESSEMSGESSSRSNIDIPQAQKDLLAALLKTGKPVVLVLFTGRPLTIKWEAENVPSILNVWFGGSEAGYAIADVLFGDVNPSGKLTTTWPQNIGQVPIYYAHKNTGRPLGEGQWFQKFRSNYLDVSNDPLYPFGYGLSYTSFKYGDIKLSDTTLKGNQKLIASIAVTNAGTKEGKEVIQLYIRDLVGSITRPVKELKDFKKIDLKPGETRNVSFTISPEDLKFYNYDLKYDWEPGEFEIMIGPNSSDVKRGKVRWTK